MRELSFLREKEERKEIILKKSLIKLHPVASLGNRFTEEAIKPNLFSEFYFLCESVIILYICSSFAAGTYRKQYVYDNSFTVIHSGKYDQTKFV